MLALILLIGEQSIPNYLSAIKLKPSIIYMLFTGANKMVEVKDNLTKAFEKELSGTPIEERIVEAYNIDSTYEICNKICQEHRDPIINLTGGTKIMALGAFRAGIENDAQLIYADTINKRFLNLGNNKLDSDQELPKLKISDFVLLAGAKITDDRTDFVRKEKKYLEPLSKILVKNHDLWQEHCLWFNGLRKKSLVNSSFSGPIKISQKGKVYYAQDLVLQALQDAKIINNLQSDNNEISFSFDSQYIENGFITMIGTPLELFTFYRCARLPNIQDVSIGVTYKWDAEDKKEKVRNELDILVSSNSRLTYISCKSGKVETSDLNELKTYSENLGGVFANKIILGREPMFSNDEFLQRAELMRIRALSISELEDDNFSL